MKGFGIYIKQLKMAGVEAFWKPGLIQVYITAKDRQ